MTEDEITVHVNGAERAAELSERDVVRAVKATTRAEGFTTGEISVTFCDEEAIANLNLRYHQRRGLTDVISFNLGEPDHPLGDIYICPAVARRSAEEYAVEPAEELVRLVVHGVLHVLGHEHPEGPERVTSDMFRRQEAILSELH